VEGMKDQAQQIAGGNKGVDEVKTRKGMFLYHSPCMRSVMTSYSTVRHYGKSLTSGDYIIFGSREAI